MYNRKWLPFSGGFLRAGINKFLFLKFILNRIHISKHTGWVWSWLLINSRKIYLLVFENKSFYLVFFNLCWSELSYLTTKPKKRSIPVCREFKPNCSLESLDFEKDCRYKEFRSHDVNARKSCVWKILVFNIKYQYSISNI